MLMKKDGQTIDHGMTKITKCGEKKGFSKTQLGFFMLVHEISCACAPYNVVLQRCFYSAKTKIKNTKNRITLGGLPISAKFNIFNQTHLSSSSPKIYVFVIDNM